MGTLRTLFAFVVVMSHLDLSVSIGGQRAVQLFYMISGFLMSYVLVERRAYPTNGAFYVARYLRLFPVYAVVLLLALLFWCLVSLLGGVPEPFAVYREAPMPGIGVLTLANATLFFQDAIMFLAVRDHQLVFSQNFAETEVRLWQGLLVPQAWTLGLELTFYAIAPFVLPRRRVLLSLLAGSLALRIALIVNGIGLQDPWTYRFFPTELALFLLGAVAHQWLVPWYRRMSDRVNMIAPTAATCGFLAITLAYQWLPGSSAFRTLLLFGLFFACLPMVFRFQESKSWDRAVGEISYPLYICHLLVIAGVSRALPQLGIGGRLAYVVVGAGGAIALAILLNTLIAQPVERYRAKFRSVSKHDAA